MNEIICIIWSSAFGHLLFQHWMILNLDDVIWTWDIFWNWENWIWKLELWPNNSTKHKLLNGHNKTRNYWQIGLTFSKKYNVNLTSNPRQLIQRTFCVDNTKRVNAKWHSRPHDRDRSFRIINVNSACLLFVNYLK